MEIYLRGRGKISLANNDYVASGGEAKVFRQGNTCFKIFHEPNKMIPEAKFDELQVLDLSTIIKPDEIIMDKTNTHIGFTSRWVEGDPLCKIFVTGFRKRNGITDDHAVKLIENIKDTIIFIHSKNCLIVDGNELNYLVADDHITPFCIDVNSWKTPNFPATAIMDSIRDHSVMDFSPATDWYSFAVIACWTFVGVHPFRGNHPDYKQPNVEERTKQRMLDRISIFNQDVKLAPNARINSIPAHYKDWFQQVFDNGVRSAPPTAAGIIVMAPVDVHVIRGTDNFQIDHIKSYDENIIWVTTLNGIDVTATTDKIYIGSKKEYKSVGNVTFTEKKRETIFSSIKDGKIEFTCPTESVRTINMYAQEIMIVKNRIYCRNGGNLIELEVDDSFAQLTPVVNTTWRIMEKSSILYAGVIYQDILGVPYLSIPIPGEKSKSAMYDIKVPELTGHKVIDAKHDSGVCAVHTSFKGKYYILVLRFDSSYKKYDFRSIEVSDIGDINMITLPQGVCILIPESGVLELFSHNPSHPDIKRIHDPIISSDMRLCKKNSQALFYKDHRLYSMKLK